MNIRRFELLDGVLTTPKQIEKLVNHPEFDRFFQALWHNYKVKADSTTSLAYWSDVFNDSKAFNRALFHLSNSGWIISNVIPMRNWGTVILDGSKLLTWVTPEELIQIRKFFKFDKYKMTHSESKITNVTKTPKGKMDVGLSRIGIAKSGNNEFSYDTEYLAKYYNVILQNTVKSIEKAIEKHQLDLDGADYRAVAVEILEYHLYSGDAKFTMGSSLSDSRGRAISNCLSKVFNPIGYKDARSLLVGPEVSLDNNGFDQIYLFISELLGCRLPTTEERIKFGRNAYANNKLHNLDMSLESDRAEVYENIWLERIYGMLMSYNGHNWNVPIELDATASVIQIEGTLLGDYNMLDEVNVVNPNELKDVWSKGMPRKQFKFASTPLLYGSTKHCTELWKKKKIEYTLDQIKIHEKELATGVLGLANDFKDYIIDNVEPKPVVKVKIMEEEFIVYCNRYMNVGDYVKKYPLFDTTTGDVKTINHTHTRRVPDLESFKRYFVTLLVHNLDSQIANEVCEDIEWVLPIYDAFIVMPNDGLDTRISYGKKIDKIYENREEIRNTYFDSIGIVKTNGAKKQWDKLQAKIVPIENFSCAITALK